MIESGSISNSEDQVTPAKQAWYMERGFTYRYINFDHKLSLLGYEVGYRESSRATRRITAVDPNYKDSPQGYTTYRNKSSALLKPAHGNGQSLRIARIHKPANIATASRRHIVVGKGVASPIDRVLMHDARVVVGDGIGVEDARRGGHDVGRYQRGAVEGRRQLRNDLVPGSVGARRERAAVAAEDVARGRTRKGLAADDDTVGRGAAREQL